MSNPSPRNKNDRSPSAAGLGAPDSFKTVSGRWLVKALLATLMAATAALYLTVCLLFYRGQWQFVFFPPKLHGAANIAALAAQSGLPIADVRFDFTEEGVGLLDGWWVPADSSTAKKKTPAASSLAANAPPIVLFCPNGRTALSGNIGALQAFHKLGISVFAFDYRGFGSSQRGHPSQQKAYADGTAALHYLMATRHVDPKSIVVYGAGVGAAVATHVAQQSSDIAGLILENPQPSFAAEVKREQHIHVLPLWLIFPQRFDVTSTVQGLGMPKLFLVKPDDPGAAALYRQTGPPKQMATLPTGTGVNLYAQHDWQRAVASFLGGLASRSR
ncbi:MAG: alpha/beta hydrolase [Acidobacteriaceae bacterium]